MFLTENKIPINVDTFGLDIKLDKPFSCPKCGATSNVTKHRLLSLTSNVVRAVPIFNDRNELIKKYHKDPPELSDYPTYAYRLAKFDRQLNQIPFVSTSKTIDYALECGHIIKLRVFADIEQLTPPDKFEALLKLGLNGENAWPLVSYTYSPDGRINEKFGKKKADEIMAIVESYHKETEAFKKFERETLANIPTSVTDLDRRMKLNLQRDVKQILDQLQTMIKSIIYDFDTVLERVAMRPELISSNRCSYVIHAGD